MARGRHLRMARLLRIEYPGAVYPVMNLGLVRQPVFRDPTDYETFLQLLSDTHIRDGFF